MFPNEKLAQHHAIAYENKKYTYGEISDYSLRLTTLILNYIANQSIAETPSKPDDMYRIALGLAPGIGSLALMNAGLASGSIVVFVDPSRHTQDLSNSK